jgi:5-methylcytosine-specific restriction endonuclease McrA
MNKADRKHNRDKIKRLCRKLLINKYGIDQKFVQGITSIIKYIKHVRPELKQNGYDLLCEFSSLPRLETSRFSKSRAVVAEKPKVHYAVTDAFLSSYEWRRVRMEVLKRYGARCQCCGATRDNGVQMNVDHIKPRKLFPELALDQSNLQVLCEVCNHGKGNWDMTDWRMLNESTDRQ